MRIKSQFRDYYDCLGSYDKEDLLYIRNRKEVTDVGLGYRDIEKIQYNQNWYLYNVNILFCGKLYCGFKFREYHNTYPYKITGGKYIFSLEKLEKLYNKLGLNYKERYFGYKSPYNRMVEVEQINSGYNNELARLNSFLELYQSPIIISDREELAGPTKNRKWITVDIVNGRLADYNFETVFNPYAAFQEISMFLGNMRKKEKPIPYIDDVTMAQAKGFDKYSFRKDPQ